MVRKTTEHWLYYLYKTEFHRRKLPGGNVNYGEPLFSTVTRIFQESG